MAPGPSADHVEQLSHLLPDLVPDRLADLHTGVMHSRGPDRFCVPSPSLLQLTVDALAASYSADRVLALLTTIQTTTDAIATATVELLADPPFGAEPRPDRRPRFALAGLPAHGTGRLTIHTIGRPTRHRRWVDTTTALKRAPEIER